MSTPEDFKKRLESLPDAQRQQMLTLLQAISKPPETIIQMFDRIGLPWERRNLDPETYPAGAVVIDWRNLMVAEMVLQEQGPILKQLMAKEFGQKAANKVQVNENGQVVQPSPPTEFKLLDQEPSNDDEGVFE